MVPVLSDAPTQAVRKAGLELHVDVRGCCRHAQGNPGHGAATISVQPLEVDASPLKDRSPPRMLLARVHVPRRRLLRLAVPYLNAVNAAAA